MRKTLSTTYTTKAIVLLFKYLRKVGPFDVSILTGSDGRMPTVEHLMSEFLPNASLQNQNLRTECEGWPNGFASRLASRKKPYISRISLVNAFL